MIRRIIFFFSWIAVFIAACTIPFLFFPSTTHAVYPIDFGGKVITLYPVCLLPIGIQVNILYAVTQVPTPLLYIPGYSAIKGAGIPYSPGQDVLGKTLGVMPCFIITPTGLPVPCFIMFPGCLGAGFFVTPIAGASPIPG